MNLRFILAWFLGSSLCVLACGGATDDDDDQFLDEAKFRERFPSQLCPQIGSCCNGIGFPINDAACRASAADAVDEMAGVGTSYDGAAAAACLRAYSAALSRCAVPSDDAIAACDQVYVGTVPEGGACQSSDQCASDAFCDPNATGALVCTSYEAEPSPHGVEGEACSGTCGGDSNDLEPCARVGGPDPVARLCYTADGLQCDTATARCVPLPGLGEPCPNFYCGGGAYCSDTSVCVAKVPDGSPCDYNEQCQDDECNDRVCGEAQITADLCAQF